MEKLIGAGIGAALVQAFAAPVIVALLGRNLARGYKLSVGQWVYFVAAVAVLLFAIVATLDQGIAAGLVNYFLLSLLVIAPIAAFAKPSAGINDKQALRGAGVVDGQQMALLQKKSGVDFTHNIHLGGVAVDYRNEAEHFLITGKTGAGKTQAINAMLRTVRGRGQAAIIADPAGGYLARFYRAGDFILNPFDSRSVQWSPFLEIQRDYDCPRIAKAAIPDASGSGREWNHYAQTLFSELLKHQWKAGNFSVKELLRLATSARPAELDKMLRDTPAGAFTALDNEKMLGSIRSVMAAYIGAWEYLPDTGTFSVRNWVREAGDNGAGWLYLTYMDNQLALLRPLVACWLEVAIVEGLSLTENPDRRLFFVMDELDSLGKVSSLRAGLTKLRKYGGVCVNGLQTIAQLRDTYGQEEAQTLLSCMSTKLLLAAGDNETADYFSREIGEQEFARKTTSTGNSRQQGDWNTTSSQTTSTEYRTERVVLPSEITSLPNLHGFLKPVGQPVNRVILDYVKMPDIEPPFLEV